MSTQPMPLRARRITAIVTMVIAIATLIFANPDSYENSQKITDAELRAEALSSVQTQADSLLAADVLDNLAVQEKHETGPNGEDDYNRKLFYDNWGLDAAGCSMREAILMRDLDEESIQMQDECKVASGNLLDPYTGKLINFIRGQKTSSAVQIDHVVALSNAWATGAYDDEKFNDDLRYALSQDPLNLIAVDGPANQEKSDQDASDWLPENEAFQCQYVARQISVKYKYHLWVTPREKITMRKVLENCPDEPTVGLELGTSD